MLRIVTNQALEPDAVFRVVELNIVGSYLPTLICGSFCRSAWYAKSTLTQVWVGDFSRGIYERVDGGS